MKVPIILAILLICLAIMGFAVYEVLFHGQGVVVVSTPKTEANNQQADDATPVQNDANTTTVYSIKMDNNCYARYQDFIKNYGQDYSKCFVSFKYNGEYCGGFNPDTQGLSNENVIVILDASGSMGEAFGSSTKMAAAKKAVTDFMEEMPQSVNTGLVVYGHEGSNSLADKQVSCAGIEEVEKLGNNNSTNIIKAMNSFSPKGWTPIAASLDFARDIFAGRGSNDKDYLILVSDGTESCDGNPLAATRDLKTQIPETYLSVIGLATDDRTSNLLKNISIAGGGSYLTAENSSDVAAAFNKQLLLIKKDCMNTTLYTLSLQYKENDLNILNCWLADYKKETDGYVTIAKSLDAECSKNISDIIKAKQDDFWTQKGALEEKNQSVYQKAETDINNQLKQLNSQ